MADDGEGSEKPFGADVGRYEKLDISLRRLASQPLQLRKRDGTETYRSYFVSSKFSDLTIRTDAAEYQVHRVIVCGQSEYFARLYNGNWTVSPS
jgi:hypothetical protein